MTAGTTRTRPFSAMRRRCRRLPRFAPPAAVRHGAGIPVEQNTSGSVHPSGCLRAFACTSTPAYVCMWRYTRIYSPPRRPPPAFTRRYLSVSLISCEIARRRLLASRRLRAFTRGLPHARRPLPVFAWRYMPACVHRCSFAWATSCVCLRVRVAECPRAFSPGFTCTRVPPRENARRRISLAACVPVSPSSSTPPRIHPELNMGVCLPTRSHPATFARVHLRACRLPPTNVDSRLRMLPLIRASQRVHVFARAEASTCMAGPQPALNCLPHSSPFSARLYLR
ncbi:hypothetical protein B0H11DRAFT_2136890 [Mycena galericulata]|nr:hypothetical protein B0H11DRAFT_2136890 [Mycena galericulata]